METIIGCIIGFVVCFSLVQAKVNVRTYNNYKRLYDGLKEVKNLPIVSKALAKVREKEGKPTMRA